MSGAGQLPTDEQLARDLRRAVVGIHRIRWILTGVMAAIVVLAVAAGAVVLVRDQARLRASCAFYRDIATIPVVTTPPATRPGEVAVAIVLHFRDAYAGEGCGPLPPEPSSLRRWAAFYHLTR